jgi:F-type H+-transporting ATPase subunit delta
MASVSTIARPYARAVFELARDARDHDGWQRQLELLAACAREPAFGMAIANPKLDAARLAEAVIGVAGQGLTDQGRNLVQLLAARKRLGVLPELLEQYKALRREAEKVVEVELVTAVAADAGTQQRFAQALERKLGRAVKLHNQVDAGLLGGALVRAGDTVIDGSIRGRLERLAAELAK